MLFKIFTLISIIAAAAMLKGCSLAGLKSGYKKEGGQVLFYSGFPATGRVLEGADAKSFKAINSFYGKDKNHVYNRHELMESADPATFEYIGGFFARDKNNGYSNEKLISTDGCHFALAPNPENKPGEPGSANVVQYAHDSKLVFAGYDIVDSADAATFNVVPMFNGQYLCYDRYHVYWNNRPLPNADGGSFKRLTAFHFKDKNNVWVLKLGQYTKWDILPEADVATFTGLKKYYGKDKNNVFCEDRIVPGADVATFEETEDYASGQDKNGLYQSGAVKK